MVLELLYYFLIFIDFALLALYKLLKAAYLGISCLLVSFCFFSQVHFFLASHIILFNKLNKLRFVLFECSTGILQGVLLATVFQIEWLNLFLNGVIRQLDKEHFFLLINEFVDVLWAAFRRELHPWLCDVDSFINFATSLHTVVVHVLIRLHWVNVFVLDPLQWHSWCRGLFVPYFQMLICFFRFFFTLLFLFPG